MSYSNNYPVVIFLPDYIVGDRGYLCGEVKSNDILKTKNFFIHEFCEEMNCATDNVIGVVGNIIRPTKKRRKKKVDWLKIRVDGNIPLIIEVLSNNIIVPHGDYQVILYDKLCFMCSELLLKEDNTSEDFLDDHFKHLVHSLKHKQSIKNNTNGLQPFLKFILIKLISCLKYIDTAISKLISILKFSTLALHMSSFVKNAVWGLELIYRKQGFTTLKSGNYILGLVGDWFGGILLIYWLISLIQIDELLNMLASHSELIVESLKDMVRYLMGSPADLKLNTPLNNVLGKFFLFHIDLWWAFLGYSRPLLELGFRMFVCLGSLGLSFQIAILADLLAIASFHVYIIYVYAARLYHAQVMGLVSLSRVFLGRKRNPLPGRVDSCPYTTEQLLIGTIAFTVLLFLLPTILVYYVVFTAIRLVLIAVGGLLTQARFVLSALPIYSTLLWLWNSPATTGSVRLTPKPVGEGGFVLVASPAQHSWWHTVKACLPDHISSPPPVNWVQLFWHLLTGKLVYPV